MMLSPVPEKDVILVARQEGTPTYGVEAAVHQHVPTASASIRESDGG